MGSSFINYLAKDTTIMVFLIINLHFFDLAQANNYLIAGFWMYDNTKKKLINVHSRENYNKLFEKESPPTYYDNVVIYKSSKNKNEEFKLPTQHIYSKKNLSSEEKKRWEVNRK